MYSRRHWQDLKGYIDTMGAIQHSSFVNLYDVVQTVEFVVLVLECIPPTYVPLSFWTNEGDCSGEQRRDGGLRRQFARGRNAFSMEAAAGDLALSSHDLQGIFVQLTQAVRYLHDEVHVAHKRLCPDNVFFDAHAKLVKVVGLRQSLLFGPLRKRVHAELDAESALSPEKEDNSPKATPVSIYPMKGSAPPLAKFRLKPLMAPPPLPIAVDETLKRKSDFYRKVARDREKYLSKEQDKSQAFATPAQARLTSSRSLGARDHEELHRQAKSNVVCTKPDGVWGFAPPEVVEACEAYSLVPTLSTTAVHVTRWDVYAIARIYLCLVDSQHRAMQRCGGCFSSAASTVTRTLRNALIALGLRNASRSFGPSLRYPYAIDIVKQLRLAPRELLTPLVGMLHPDPRDRWDCSGVLAFPAVKELIAIADEAIASPPPAPWLGRN
jgi:serine/threonine protein kinase